MTPRRPSRRPAQRGDDGDDGGDDGSPAEAVRIEEVPGIYESVTAVDLQQAGGAFRNAGDDAVKKGRLAAEDEAGDRESGGQQTGDGEEHVEADAGTHQRPVLQGVVLPCAHWPEGVEPGEHPLEHGHELGYEALARPAGLAPLDLFANDLQLQARLLSGKRLPLRRLLLGAVPVGRQVRCQSQALPVAAKYRWYRARKVPC
jgi:hypothetical protein